jgi:hypothetical protein
MVELEKWMGSIPLFIVVFGQMGGIALSSVFPAAGFYLFILATIPGTGFYIAYVQWVAEFQARKHHLIKALASTKLGIAYWTWRGILYIWHQGEPAKKWIQDGYVPLSYRNPRHPERSYGFWEFYLNPTKKVVKHPKYNRGDRIQLYVLRSIYPWHKIIRYIKAGAIWNGVPVTGVTQATVWLDEMMPESSVVSMTDDLTKTRDADRVNGVPYVDPDGLVEAPVFWIRVSNATRIMEDERDEMERKTMAYPRPQVQSRGQSTVFAEKCSDCQAPLPQPVNGVVECRNCHSYFKVEA